MANYDDALKVMDAVAKYREDESLPVSVASTGLDRVMV